MEISITPHDFSALALTPGEDARGETRVDSKPSDREPLVSVILAVHNRESCVGRAIESVLAQDYRNIELIVVDDGSTDLTRTVAESYGESLRLVSQAHGGAYAARNLGLEHAKGEL